MSGMDRLTAIERHADTERNRILNIALTDLNAIINGHNPDVDTSINNMVWDRLDKLACDVELLAHRRASQAAPARPTEAMLNAARDWSDAKYGKPIGNDAAIGCWNAMLAAAPAPSDGLREEAAERTLARRLNDEWNAACNAIAEYHEDQARKDKAEANSYRAEGTDDGSVEACLSDALCHMESANRIRALRRAAHTEREA